MSRDHTQEYKVLKWRKENHQKWRRWVSFFSALRKTSQWNDMSFNDAVAEFEKLD